MKNFSTKTAIERLQFTILKQNKPNQTDADALNILTKEISENQIKKVENNKVFGKLLLLFLKNEYEKNNDINTGIYLLSEFLKPTLNEMLVMFANQLQTTQLINYIKTLAIDADIEKMDTDIDYIKLIENKFWNNNQKNIIEEIKFLNSASETIKNFYMTANEILNNENFKN